MQLEWIRKHIRHNLGISFATMIFMMLSGMLIAITIFLSGTLLHAIDDLMEVAKTPHFLQMHGGEIQMEELKAFAEASEDVEAMQVSTFLNLENGLIFVRGRSFSESTQDNGLCLQNDKFDFLIDLEQKVIEAKPGEIYVPVCYQEEYKIQVGDSMMIGNYPLQVAGFLRDSQMNSTMASSKRFLVHDSDYKNLKSQGKEEYLISFRLFPDSDLNAFSNSYQEAKLPCNGPTITYSLIRLMNALSDGLMIIVIFLVSVVVLLISLLCIRYIILTSLAKDKKEIGTLKAMGISRKDIRRRYMIQYGLFALTGGFFGIICAWILSGPLGKGMQLLYGTSRADSGIWCLAILGIVLQEGILLFSVQRNLKSLANMTAMDAFRTGKQDTHQKGQYRLISGLVATSVFMMLVPVNLATTISSPKFVTYMGIGDSQIRMDVRQCEDILGTTGKVVKMLNQDDRVEQFVVMNTSSCPVQLVDGSKFHLLVEFGNHSLFPVHYTKGREPRASYELALSQLNADEWKLQVGDTLFFTEGEEIISYSICGIYSDITNGGKTAKVYRENEESMQGKELPVMWSVIYVGLQEYSSTERWVGDYEALFSKEGLSVEVVDIPTYVTGTYGRTISQIRMSSILAVIAAALIILVILLLFMRLIFWQERQDISFRKALGLSNRNIRKIYQKKCMVSVVTGIVLGMIGGIYGGQMIAGALLARLGASGFTFVWNPWLVLLGIPCMTIGVSMLAETFSFQEIKKIKAYECCIVRD